MLYDFHVALFLVAASEPLVRGSRTSPAELPLHSRTLKDYRHFPYGTRAEAAARLEIPTPIRSGNSKSKVSVNDFLKELVLYPG